MENIQQAFELFCEDDNLRPVFQKPFISDSLVCATDAYSIIYVKEGDFDIETSSEYKAPNVSGIIPTELHDPVIINIKELESQLQSKCPLVDEMTECEDECTSCDGDGEVECNFGHMHDCEDCDGEGYHDKSTPTGNKIIDPACRIRLLEGVFYYRQIARLIKACNLLGINELSKVYGYGNKGFLFQHGKVNILVMPTTSSEPDVIIKS